jgi:putative endonuclease
MKQAYVYIMTNERNGTLYVVVTSDLKQRAYQHKNHIYEGFTADYDLDKLVYYEVHDDVEAAIHREKRLKEWQRNWKKDLIEK